MQHEYQIENILSSFHNLLQKDTILNNGSMFKTNNPPSTVRP